MPINKVGFQAININFSTALTCHIKGSLVLADLPPNINVIRDSRRLAIGVLLRHTTL